MTGCFREFQIQEEHEAELSKLQQALSDVTAQLQAKADEVNKLTAEVRYAGLCFKILLGVDHM